MIIEKYSIRRKMKTRTIIATILLIASILPVSGQNRGLKTITEKELRYHLGFLASPEFRGRMTPSPELEIATVYLGNWAQSNGLTPILPDGSFYQAIPLRVTEVSEPNTRLRVITRQGEQVYYYGKSFGGNFSNSGSYSGDALFVGLGISNPEKTWDDLKDLELANKMVILLDEPLPGSRSDLGSTYAYRLSSRISLIREKGAAGVLYIIPPELEAQRIAGAEVFERIPAGRMIPSFETQRRGAPVGAASREQTAPSVTRRPSLPFGQAAISHELAAAILGMTPQEVGALFATIRGGKAVPARMTEGMHIQLTVETETHQGSSRNVIAAIPGSDPILKDEYVVICAHHDHLGISDGQVIAGADDDGTGTVALLEIAQALMTERPKRTVIIAWFTGEEQGLYGSHFFANNCPVPVEKISTCLNLDMLGRNSRDSLYLVGSNLLSSELDAAIRKVNRNPEINFGFDYLYSNLTHPQRVYFRSDHYPFIRFGIPSVWIFCGFTPDYHTPKDVLEFIDWQKFLKVTKLTYLSAMETGNRKELLKLDVNPEVKVRGSQNLSIRSLYEKVN
jgi:Zn-dependent M28 family amino/carboxypeptidase